VGRRGRLRSESGASAVEFALLAPLLFMLVFAIIGFGIGFLKVQSVRTAVREGGRAAAVGAPVNSVGSMKGTRETTVDASSGAIPPSLKNTIQVTSSEGGRCTSSNIGEEVTVTYPVPGSGEGSIVVSIPFLPSIILTPTITASFRCEV
jgi:Flp pilus assembly protein TadG